MRSLVRTAVVAALAAGFLVVSPATAPAAPKSNLYTGLQDTLLSLAESEEDAAKKTALEQAAAFFDDASPSLAHDMGDAIKAVRKLEAAFGKTDETVGGVLDGNIGFAYIAAFGRAQQAYVGAALKETSRRNFGAVRRLARTHTAKVRAATRVFPEKPNKPIGRIAKLTALRKLETYGAALGRRYKVELNAF